MSRVQVLRTLLALGLCLPAGAARAAEWRLAAAYDLAAVQAIGELEALEEGEERALVGNAWRAARGMVEACGPAKAPDGLGVMEAEAVSAGLTPALVLLLEGDGAAAPTRDRIQVALADPRAGEERRVLLQPMVQPRYLAVSLAADDGMADGERVAQLVRTQLAMELCMEHKVGRGWLGSDREGLRQAFMLSRPDGGRVDRKFMGGQRDPAPALLGPPDACLRGSEGGLVDPPGADQGEGSLSLVPADVWGAALRPCEPGEEPGATPEASPWRTPLSWGPAAEGAAAGEAAARWQGLDLRLFDDAAGTARYSLALDGQALVDGGPLFEQEAGQPVVADNRLADLLARVPHVLPTVGPAEDPHRYVVLVVPAWQLDEALGRLSRDEVGAPLARVAPGRRNPVAWVLANPAWLRIQVPEGPDQDAGSLDLSAALGGTGLSWRGWGYQVGLLQGRSPVVTTGAERPTWAQASAAQRAPQQAAVLLSLGVLVVFCLTGLLRLRDLWTPTPTERAAYWPGGRHSGPQAGSDEPSGPSTSVVGESA